MKSFRFLLVSMVVVMGLLQACKKDDTPTVSNSLTLRIRNTVDGQPLQLGQMTYTNVSGNTYQVDLLRYYMSNVTLLRQDGSGFNIGNYDLINAEDASSCVISGSNIPNGSYDSLRFYLGVDSTRNNDLAQTGDLDPSYGMYWPWNTGYIFFKHEGYYLDTAGATQDLLLHYGTSVALVTVTLPANVVFNNQSRTIDVDFNLNDVYNQPVPIDFNVDNYHQSSSGNERNWIENMKLNFGTAFSVTGIE